MSVSTFSMSGDRSGRIVCMLHDDGTRLRIWVNLTGGWWAEISAITRIESPRADN